MHRRSVARRFIGVFEERKALTRTLGVGFLGLCLAGTSSWLLGCNGWDLRSPFEHNAPEVDQAVRDLDAGKPESAEKALEEFLKAGHCSGDGGIQLSTDVRRLPNGSFDLGITLFNLGERFGQRFGDEEVDGGPNAEKLAERRATEVNCALAVIRSIASDPAVPTELRARAHYLAGNLEFLVRRYEDAVHEYDQALALVPGLIIEAGGDGIGRDAAWNRAIALRRIEDQKDSGPDASPDASDKPDAADGSDGGNDGGQDAGPDSGDSGSKPDAGDKGDSGDDQDKKDGGDKGDAGNDKGDGGNDKGDAGSQGDSGANDKPQPDKSHEPPAAQQDNRMLEQLEQAPSYQGQEAKQRARTRRGAATMEDK